MPDVRESCWGVVGFVDAVDAVPAALLYVLRNFWKWSNPTTLATSHNWNKCAESPALDRGETYSNSGLSKYDRRVDFQSSRSEKAISRVPPLDA